MPIHRNCCGVTVLFLMSSFTVLYHLVLTSYSYSQDYYAWSLIHMSYVLQQLLLPYILIVRRRRPRNLFLIYFYIQLALQVYILSNLLVSGAYMYTLHVPVITGCRLG